MENKRYKIRSNSAEKIEELLQEIYDQICRQINEIQNEISKLVNSTNLGADDFNMDDKSKYFKAFHDLSLDKKNALDQKKDIAKLMSEILKYHGDVNSVINDKNAQKRTSLNLKSIRDAVNENNDVNNYTLKNN